MTVQFLNNLKRAKKASIAWSKEKRLREERLLSEIVNKMRNLYNSEGFEFLSAHSKHELQSLEAQKEGSSRSIKTLVFKKQEPSD